MAKFDVQEDVQYFFNLEEETGFSISGSSLVLQRPIEFHGENGAVTLVLNNVTYTVQEDELGIRRLSMSGDVEKRFSGIGRMICSLHMSQSADPIPFMDHGYHQIANIEAGSFVDTDKILKLIGHPAKYAKRLFFTGRLNRFIGMPEGQEVELARAAG